MKSLVLFPNHKPVRPEQIQIFSFQPGGIAQWRCPRLWVQFPALQKEKKKLFLKVQI
jgi:hypothetical protein